MPTQHSSILSSINRPAGRPLRILTSPTHEAYETLLARSGNEFYGLELPQTKKWNRVFRPVPENYQLFRGNNPQEILREDMVFDLVLSQNRFGQYQVLSPVAQYFAIPLVTMEHTLPPPQWTAQTKAKSMAMRGDINAFISHHNVREWGWDPADPTTRIAGQGTDPDFFVGWEGGDGRVLTVVNDYVNRDVFCGFGIYQEVTKGLATNPWGDTRGFSQPAKSLEHLRDLYRKASVFLNTTTYSSLPTTVLEAMAVGCPVVSTAYFTLPEIIQDGVNGYCSNDPKILRRRLMELMSDQAMAREIGQAGRRTVVERFGPEQFIDTWNGIFEAAVSGRPLSWLC